jgi:putative membrane protein insertion efficiency factor
MKALATTALRLYKGLISPLLPAACRYVPTCSEYAAEAVACHGFFHGTALALWRLLRCNPLARGGYDPVPRNQ